VSDWYASSAAHALVPVFAISTAYTVGQFVRRITSTAKAQWVMRCTVAGTSAASEPTWPTANNGTVVSGGATFANVTGQSAYGWSAAAGDVATIMTTSNRLAGGDRIFISSDHTETQTALTNYGTGTTGPSSFSVIQYICVNRAGSVPPVAADVTTGATIGSSSVIAFMATAPCYYYGITFTTSSLGVGAIALPAVSPAATHVQFFKNCALAITGASGTPAFFFMISAGVWSVVLDNTSLSHGHAGQKIAGASAGNLFLTWQNTPSPLAGTTPTSLFASTGGASVVATFRGVDLSAITSSLVTNSSQYGSKYLFDSCKIASAVTRYSTSSVANSTDEVELVYCFDGTNIISERYQPAGAVTTESTITLSGGATDNVGTFAHKMVSNANVDKYANPLNSFWMDVGYATTGASKTATVEIISSASLNNDEISLELEYLGTASSSLATITNTLPATVLTTPAAVTTSTATWNSSPATPAKQKLQVTFTPQTAGRVRGRVRLGKASSTVYINPQVTIT
jgi:hypothetical protein